MGAFQVEQLYAGMVFNEQVLGPLQLLAQQRFPSGVRSGRHPYVACVDPILVCVCVPCVYCVTVECEACTAPFSSAEQDELTKSHACFFVAIYLDSAARRICSA